MRDELERWIGEQLGETVRVTELRRITTGHSRGNWFLELDGGSRFVVRVEQGGVFGTAGADEYEFMRAVGRVGFPVARVRWLEPAGTVIGQPFFVMDFIEGGVATEREDAPWPPTWPWTSCAGSTNCTGVLPSRRPERGLVVPAVDARRADDAARGVDGADAARGGRGGGREAAALLAGVQLLQRACANRSCLKAFAGANPAPNMALIGTVLQQTFMRQMADLIAR